MRLKDLFLDTVNTLWSHKLRTFLTMFGISWGIVSIVIMTAAGEGLRVAGTCSVRSTHAVVDQLVRASAGAAFRVRRVAARQNARSPAVISSMMGTMSG